MIHTKVPLTTSFEAWFLDGLRQVAAREHKDLNEIIEECVLQEYPQIKELKRGFIGRVLSPRHSTPSPAAPSTT